VIGQRQRGDEFNAIGGALSVTLQVAAIAGEIKNNFVVDDLVKPDDLERECLDLPDQSELPASGALFSQGGLGGRRSGKGALVVGDFIQAGCTEPGADGGAD